MDADHAFLPLDPLSAYTHVNMQGLQVAEPYTIRIFVPDGDPDSVRIIDRMNWTGLGITFPRDKWPSIKHRTEFTKTGVYVLVGYVSEEDELPTLYVGQGDGIRNRIEAHFQNKDFGTGELLFCPRVAAA